MIGARIIVAAAIGVSLCGGLAAAQDGPRDMSDLPNVPARQTDSGARDNGPRDNGPRDNGPRDNGLRDIRVQVVPAISTVIGAPMAGRLTEFPLHDGDRFEQGQVIARFACAEREGALARARAVLLEKRRVLANKQQLRSLGNSTGLDYDIAAAEVSEANADISTAEAMTESCTITAPFSGRVADVAVHPFQFIGLGTPMLEILSDRDLELEMIVPSHWLSWLAAGTKFDVVIDETGRTYAATLTRMSGKVDPVSRSIKVYGHITADASDLLPGMSGRALLAPPRG